MKKNKALTAALSVFALTMMSMCAIGGTFAKYVTTGSDQDTARVAKWGVTITYTADDVDTTTELNGDEEAHLSSTQYLMAPGTKGHLVSVVVTGTPEVSVHVEQEATFDLTGDWTIDHDGDNATAEIFHCPIVFYVDGDAIPTQTSEKDLENAIITALERSTDFVANTDLSTKGFDRSLRWEWAFENNLDNTKDKYDTLLGDNAATANLGFTVGLTTTISQID